MKQNQLENRRVYIYLVVYAAFWFVFGTLVGVSLYALTQTIVGGWG